MQEFQAIQRLWLHAAIGVFLVGIIVFVLLFGLLLGGAFVSLGSDGVELDENEIIFMRSPTGEQMACC